MNPRIAGSAVVVGRALMGEDSYLAQGAVIRSAAEGVTVGTGSMVLENYVVLGDPAMPTTIGRRTVFGHRCTIVGATVGDGVIIGPSAMIHGCHIGAGSVVEPAGIVCDSSELGPGCVVRAGAVVKQRSKFGPGSYLDGFPAREVGHLDAPPELPAWAFRPGVLPGPLAPSR